MAARPRNLFREFYLANKAADPRRTFAWWAERWKIENASTLRRWAADPDAHNWRRIGPRHHRIFGDPLVRKFRAHDGARLDMATYYQTLPPSAQRKPDTA